MGKFFKYREAELFTFDKNTLLDDFILLTVSEKYGCSVYSETAFDYISYEHKKKLLDNKEFKEAFELYCDYFCSYLDEHSQDIEEEVLKYINNTYKDLNDPNNKFKDKLGNIYNAIEEDKAINATIEEVQAKSDSNNSKQDTFKI